MLFHFPLPSFSGRGTGRWGRGGAIARSGTFMGVPRYRGCCRTTTTKLPQERRWRSIGEHAGQTDRCGGAGWVDSAVLVDCDGGFLESVSLPFLPIGAALVVPSMFHQRNQKCQPTSTRTTLKRRRLGYGYCSDTKENRKTGKKHASLLPITCT